MAWRIEMHPEGAQELELQGTRVGLGHDQNAAGP
jgi:hypothetical protein